MSQGEDANQGGLSSKRKRADSEPKGSSAPVEESAGERASEADQDEDEDDIDEEEGMAVRSG